MDTTVFIIIVFFGLIVGSFLNSVIYRFDDLRTILVHRSHCPHCKQEIKWYDLIPLLSFIVLAGKCRSCKKLISYQYPLIEFFTALIFGLLYIKFGLDVQLFFYLIVSSILIIIFAYDGYKQLIPDNLVVAMLIFWLTYVLFADISNFNDYMYGSIIGSLIGGIFLGLIVLATKGKGMGIGDVKLALIMGLILGWKYLIIALFFAFVIGALYGVVLLLLRKKNLKSSVAFGPFMVIGFYVALFLGGKIINWYLY